MGNHRFNHSDMQNISVVHEDRSEHAVDYVSSVIHVPTQQMYEQSVTSIHFWCPERNIEKSP